MNDDTQPRSPFQDSQPPIMGMNPPEDDTPAGPGCFFWGLISMAIFSFSLLIVMLAGAAGWTSGQRLAQADATATVNHRIAQQFEQIPTDLAAGNLDLLQFRLDYLMGVTPAVNGLADVQRSATQLAVNLQPTITPTPSATATPTATLPAPEVTQAAEITPEATAEVVDSRFDIEALLLEAQRQVDLGEYEDAIDTLDAIMGIDENYRREVVRDLMARALRNQATLLFQSTDTVAEAIILTNRAEEFGPIGDLDYERFIGGLYLDAVRTIDLGNYLAAIRSLSEIAQYQTTYKGININEQIFNQYVAYGDALVAGGQYCQAVGQFNSALSLFNNNVVTGKRDAAQNTCQQGIQLTLTPGVSSTQDGVAPVGQPGG